MNWINSLKLIQNPNPGYASFRQLNNIWEFNSYPVIEARIVLTYMYFIAMGISMEPRYR